MHQITFDRETHELIEKMLHAIIYFIINGSTFENFIEYLEITVLERSLKSNRQERWLNM